MTTRRSASNQESVARTGGCPRTLANPAAMGALSASISGSPDRCSDHVNLRELTDYETEREWTSGKSV